MIDIEITIRFTDVEDTAGSASEHLANYLKMSGTQNIVGATITEKD